MSTTPYLSVVIPSYNEEENLRKGVIKTVENYLKKQPYTWEIIFVDDGSTDKTKELLRSYCSGNNGIYLIESSHNGKAKTVTKGVLEAKGEIVLFTDFDQATPIAEIEKLLPYFKTHDVVIGSRKDERKGAPLSRRIMARGFMILRNIILGVGIEDTQCGFKAFKNSTAKKLFRKPRLYKQQKAVKGSRVTAGFDVELLYLAKKMGASVKEVPVSWSYQETRRVSPFRDSLDGFTDLIRIRVNSMRGLYK